MRILRVEGRKEEEKRGVLREGSESFSAPDRAERERSWMIAEEADIFFPAQKEKTLPFLSSCYSSSEREWKKTIYSGWK